MSYAVVGGEGFLGHAMLEKLSERYPGAAVASFDVVRRHHDPRWSFHTVDMTDPAGMDAAFAAAKPQVVIHTASPWVGFGHDVCQKVNVGGTTNVVEACLKYNVRALVFTSSAGVVYEGKDLKYVDERMPFVVNAPDPYNSSKAEAERIARRANGRLGADGKTRLLTAALRPAGIFGPGDRQAVPGFMNVLKSGKSRFQVGNNENLFDWTYVDNVVYAHLLAAEKLLATHYVPRDLAYEESNPVVPTEKQQIDFVYKLDAMNPVSERRRTIPTSDSVDSLLPDHKEPPLPVYRNRFDPYAFLALTDPRKAIMTLSDAHDYNIRDADLDNRVQPTSHLRVDGEAFFITNGEPLYFWDFPRALWAEYNGHVDASHFVLPAAVGIFLAAVAEFLARLLGKQANFTPARVIYSTTHRYYNIEKARRLLGYEAQVGLGDGIRRAIAHYKEQESAEKKKTD